MTYLGLCIWHGRQISFRTFLSFFLRITFLLVHVFRSNYTFCCWLGLLDGSFTLYKLSWPPAFVLQEGVWKVVVGVVTILFRFRAFLVFFPKGTIFVTDLDMSPILRSVFPIKNTEISPKLVDSDHTCCVDPASYEAEKCKSWKCWGLIEFGGVDRVIDRRRQVEEWPEAAETKFNHCPKRKWWLSKHVRQQVVPYTINRLLAYSPDIVSPLSNL